MRKRRRLVSRWRWLISGGVVVSIVAGIIGPVGSANAEVALDETGLRNVLFGSAMRIVDHDPAFDRHLVLSAELLGWRAAYPKASAAEILAHLQAVDQATAAAVPAADLERPVEERVPKLLKAVQDNPAARATSPAFGEIIAAMVGRDMLTWIGVIADRISGAEQQFNLTYSYSDAQRAVWSAVATAARADQPFREAWNSHIGAALGIDPAASLAQLADLPGFVGLIDVDAVLALQDDPQAWHAEVMDQFTALLERFDAMRLELIGLLPEHKDGQPAPPNTPGTTLTEPTKAQKDAAKEQEKEIQEGIDGAKAAVDGLAKLADLDPEATKQIQGIGTAAAAIATAINKFVTESTLVGVANALGAMAGVALTGNIAAAIAALLPLFTGGGPTIEQVILEEIQNIRQDIAALRARMEERFDRIEKTLNKLYGDMMTQFERLNQSIEVVRQQATDIAHKLVTLESQSQVLGAWMLNAIGDDDLNVMMAPANQYLDYEAKYGIPIPSYTFDYAPAENAMHYGATSMSSHASFVYTGENTAQPDVVLGGIEPTGAVNYLANYALQYDPNFPQPAQTVPNVSVWGPAARGYAILAMQNPGYAKNVNKARGTDVAGIGQRILNAMLAFSQPRTYGSSIPINPTYTNRLFAGLMNDYLQRTVAMANNLVDIESQVVNAYTVGGDPRPFDLFGAPEQAVSKEDLEGPDTLARCDSSSAATVPAPFFANGTTLTPALMFARYIRPNFGNLQDYSACWSNAAWTNIEETSTSSSTKTTYKITADLNVTFRQYMTWPGENKVQVRTANGKVNQQVCGWTEPNDGPVVQPPACATTMPNAAQYTQVHGAALHFLPAGSASNNAVAESVAHSRMQTFLDNERQFYYEKAFRDFVPTYRSVKNVNTATSLLRAYTQLGFARALESDEQLRALLYGINSLPANLPDNKILYNTFAFAAANYASGTKSALANQPQLDPFPNNPGCATAVQLGVVTKDPLARCIVLNAQKRQQLLATQYEKHFTEIALHGNQEAPASVTTALADLVLANNFVHQEG
jgi:hypothetical protein